MSRPVRLVLAVVLLAGCTATPPAATPDSPTATPEPSTARRSPDSTADPANATGRVVTVIEVVDGDTADVRYENGTTDTIRLLGIDVPETRAENAPGEFEGVPDTRAGRAWLACWGKRAGEYLRDHIAGEEVRIVTDELADRRGEYGRLLVYVYHDGSLLNRRLLERGLARLYDSTFAKRDRFARAESSARAAERGLWGFESNGTTPADQTCEPPSTHSVSPVT